jgi:hypothetical protein
MPGWSLRHGLSEMPQTHAARRSLREALLSQNLTSV